MSDEQHAAIATIGAFTAVGDLDRLTTAPDKALDAGVTINQSHLLDEILENRS